MVAKELSLEEQEAANGESILLQDPYESEETLSLCDLPIHNDSFKWDDDFSKDGHNSSSNNNDDDEDFFEFFSEDFAVSTRGNTKKSIIFCGKIIHYKEPSKYLHQKEKNFESNCKKDHVIPSSESVKAHDGGSMRGQRVKGSKDLLWAYPEEKVSLVRSRTKSRWYLFLFGMSRLPTQMELRDIRRRQSQPGPTAVSPAPEERRAIQIKERRNGKGIWRILSSLGFGCYSKYATDVVKNSFGYV